MIKESRCFERRCTHYQGILQKDGTEKNERPYCTAFPDGIPDNIAYGKNKHTRPIEGQGNDITFEKWEG